MKLRNCLFLAILTSFILVAAACYQEQAGWRGKISQENGQTVISNPKEPMYSWQVPDRNPASR